MRIRNYISGLFKTPHHVICIVAENHPIAIYQKKQKIVLLLPYHCTWNFFFQKLHRKNSAIVGIILQPPYNLLFGLKRDGSGCCFLYSGPLSCPWMVATCLLNLKRTTSCLFEACTFTRVAVLMLDWQPRATRDHWPGLDYYFLQKIKLKIEGNA